MNVVLLLWRSRLRSSWRAAVVLVALIGLGGGVALAVGAGARRTASANDAILRSTNAADIGASYGPEDPRQIEQAVRGLDGVTDTRLWVGFLPIPPRDDVGLITLIGFWEDPVTVSRPIVTAGRFPAGPTEAMVNEAAATSLRLAPGDHIELALVDESFANPRTVGLDIVGAGLLLDEVIEDELGHKPAFLAPRAFTERHLDRAHWGSAAIDLAPGADAEAIGGKLGAKGILVDNDLGEDRTRVQAALRPLLVTLAGLAALAATATVLVAGQALNRLMRRRRSADRSLAAMGCSTRQLVGADLLHAATVAGGGSALAAILAVAVSPLFPVGPVRRAAVSRGVEADLLALGIGSAVLASAIVTIVGLGSWRRRTVTRAVSPGRAPPLLASRPAAATGLRLTTAQRGVAVTVAGVAAGLAVVVAAVTFTGSLGRLIGDPALVGLSWDVGGRASFDHVDVGQVRRLAEDDPTVERVTALSYGGGVTVNGTTVVLATLDPVKGSPWPPLVAGRVPAADDEVLVGRSTLDQLGIAISSTVTVAVPAGDPSRLEAAAVTKRVTVVGSAVAPTIGLGGTDSPKLDIGVLASSQAIALPAAPSPVSVVLFDLAEGTPAGDLVGRFPGGLPVRGGTPTEWFTSAAPAEVNQAEGARTVIWLGVASLGVAIIGSVVHTLLVSVRQRRREYAVLRALGFTRAQVRTTVLWQSGALVVLALALAVPVGVAAGRWLWTAFAKDLGIVADPAVPLLLLAGGVLATILLVQGASLVPASLAERTPLAQTLRSE